MMVMINSFRFSIVPEIAELIAAGYPDCAVMDMSRFSPQDPDAPGDRVRSEQAKGTIRFVVFHAFHSPSELKALRVFFSAFDDEIYAFRLRFTSPAAAMLMQGPPGGRMKSAYAEWLDDQEAGARIGDMGHEIVLDTPAAGAAAAAIREDIHEPIDLVPYRSDWRAMYSMERECITTALEGIITGVEHIGSTAIPGMAAKPVVDILAFAPRLADGFKCIQPLRGLGYSFIDYPQNIDRLFFRKGKPRDHHLHIVQDRSRSHLDHVNFRDALLADDRLRLEYLELKQAGMAEFRDRRALYGEKKGGIIRKALERYRTQRTGGSNSGALP